MRKEKVLISGGTGFVGSWLLEEYLKEPDKYDVYATKKWRSDITNVDHIKDKIKWFDMDLSDSHSIESVIKQVKPQKLHHLAAMSFVASSFKYPAQTLEVNLLGSLHLFEAVRRHSPKTVIQIAGSSEEYGIPEVTPITESMLPKPCSPYGLSKLSMTLLAQNYVKAYGMRIVTTRTFNHTGPRRGDSFVCSSFAKQIAEIEIGIKESVIEHGNLDAIRDFTDARDIVLAYKIAINKCKYGVIYNICSGTEITIKQILMKLASMSDNKIHFKQDPERMRPSDLHTLIGDYSKFKNLTEWTPNIPFDKTLEDLLNYWRERVGK